MAMTDAERLFFAGGAHARAAHAIVAAAQANVHMTVPFYLLVGFSLETVLKAAFLHLGGDMKFAKQHRGNKLERWEIGLIKAMVADGRWPNDQDIVTG